MNKDLGFFTKHAEKLILGLSLLLLLAVGAYAWLGVFGDLHPDPNKVKDDINAAADAVERNLTSDSTFTMPAKDEYIVPDYAGNFAQQYNQPATTLAQFNARPDNPGMFNIDVEVLEWTPLFLPTPPVADAFKLKFKHAVLADVSMLDDPQLRQMVVDVQPIINAPASGDFQYISVMAEFPLKQWAQRLDAADQPAGSQIPDNVWFAKLGLASVYLIREEQQLDGSWSNRTIVDPLPQQIAHLPTDAPATDKDPLLAAQLLDQVRAQQELITKPDFPPTVFQHWTPPTGRDRILSPDEQKQLADLEKEIKSIQRRIDRANGVDSRQSTQRRRQPSRSSAGEYGGGSEYGVGGGGGISRNTTQRTGGNDRAQREKEKEQQKLQKLQDDMLEARKQKNELLGLEGDEDAQGFLQNRSGMRGGGMGEYGMEMGEYGMEMGGMSGGGQNFGSARPSNRLNRTPGVALGRPQRLTDEVPETLRIWAHDLTAQPGKTYRYKLIAAAINPLFQYSRVPADQKSANEFRLALPPSDEDIDAAPWSTPVTLDPKAYFFFVRGNADQDRATVEVWKVFQGQWRKGEFEEAPGNPIGGSKNIEIAQDFNQDVDMTVGAVLLDIDTVEINNSPQVRMVYLLPDGRISSRVLNADRRDPKRSQLEIEAETEANLRDSFADSRR